MEQGSPFGPEPRSGEWAERREAWTLDGEGRLNVAITTSRSGAEPEHVMLVYRRD